MHKSVKIKKISKKIPILGHFTLLGVYFWDFPQENQRGHIWGGLDFCWESWAKVLFLGWVLFWGLGWRVRTHPPTQARGGRGTTFGGQVWSLGTYLYIIMNASHFGVLSCLGFGLCLNIWQIWWPPCRAGNSEFITWLFFRKGHTWTLEILLFHASIIWTPDIDLQPLNEVSDSLLWHESCINWTIIPGEYAWDGDGDGTTNQLSAIIMLMYCEWHTPSQSLETFTFLIKFLFVQHSSRLWA